MSIIRDVTLRAKAVLKSPEILLFIGARQAGKTTILKQLQTYLNERGENTQFLNLEDPDYLKLLNETPKNLFSILPIDLKKRTTLFIDEIQYLSNPSNFLKYFYDEYQNIIHILASGSSAFYLDRKFKDSLAGRKKIFYVRTLSFREFLRFKQENELAKKNWRRLALLEKEKIHLFYQEFITFGGYPRVVLAEANEKKDLLREIAYSYVKKDIFEAHVRQEEVFYKLFKILAANTGQLLNSNELASTLRVSKTSIEHYLWVMQKSFHVHLLRPFYRNLRKELTKMPKVYFYDIGLRNFFTNNFELYEWRMDKGALLENAVFRQLLENEEEENIHFWRTQEGNEVDFILNGKTALEVKTDPKQFRKSKYRTFLKTYPDIEFKSVSFTREKTASLQAWEL